VVDYGLCSGGGINMDKNALRDVSENSLEFVKTAAAAAGKVNPTVEIAKQLGIAGAITGAGVGALGGAAYKGLRGKSKTAAEAGDGLDPIGKGILAGSGIAAAAAIPGAIKPGRKLLFNSLNPLFLTNKKAKLTRKALKASAKTLAMGAGLGALGGAVYKGLKGKSKTAAADERSPGKKGASTGAKVGAGLGAGAGAGVLHKAIQFSRYRGRSLPKGKNLAALGLASIAAPAALGAGLGAASGGAYGKLRGAPSKDGSNPVGKGAAIGAGLGGVANLAKLKSLGFTAKDSLGALKKFPVETALAHGGLLVPGVVLGAGAGALGGAAYRALKNRGSK
jgi:hypothetical protein